MKCLKLKGLLLHHQYSSFYFFLYSFYVYQFSCSSSQATLSNYFFDKIEAHITPNSPHIPDIQVKRFSVCGSIEIFLLPPGLSQVSRCVSIHFDPLFTSHIFGWRCTYYCSRLSSFLPLLIVIAMINYLHRPSQRAVICYQNSQRNSNGLNS